WGNRISAKVTVLDLGTGAAVHVRMNSHDWLIDCGSERSYERIVRQYLHWVGVNRLTGLLLTHGDSQHIGGVTQLLSDFPRVYLIDNPAPDHSLIHRRLSRMVSGLEGRGGKLQSWPPETISICPATLSHMFCFHRAASQEPRRMIKRWLSAYPSRRADLCCSCPTTAQKPSARY